MQRFHRSFLGELAAWWHSRGTSQRRDTEAADARQEVALRAIESGAAVRHPRAFVARIARNIAIDDARKLKVRGGAALQLDELPDHLAPSVAADQETTLLFKQIILGLPPLHRDVFILSRFNGLSYAEIAQQLNVSVKTVEYRMARALALCEAALRD